MSDLKEIREEIADKTKLYRDDYFISDDSTQSGSEKGYTQILAVPGRALQAREITQIGSIAREQISALGSAVFSNGTIIEGCDINIDLEKESTKSVSNENLVLDTDGIKSEFQGSLSKRNLKKNNVHFNLGSKAYHDVPTNKADIGRLVVDNGTTRLDTATINYRLGTFYLKFKPDYIPTQEYTANASYEYIAYTCEVGDGRVFIGSNDADSISNSGLVREWKGGSVEISMAGIEAIGFKLECTIVTGDGDYSLRDPAYFVQGDITPREYIGADRLKEELVLTVNDPDAITIITLNDGEIKPTVESGTNFVTFDGLATRIYEESGNYKVEGLNLSGITYSDASDEVLDNELTNSLTERDNLKVYIEKMTFALNSDNVTYNYDTPDGILCKLSSGISYVNGYRCERSVDTTFKLEPYNKYTYNTEGYYSCTAWQTDVFQSNEYHQGFKDDGKLRYLLSKQAVSFEDLGGLIGGGITLSGYYPEKHMSRDQDHNYDDLGKTNISADGFKVWHIVDGVRVDIDDSKYSLSTSTGILTWNETVIPGGGSYYVSYRYNAGDVDGWDFRLHYEYFKSGIKTYLQFNDHWEDLDLENGSTVITVKYRYRLPRIDLVSLDDTNSVISQALGYYDDFDLTQSAIGSRESIPIGYVVVTPVCYRNFSTEKERFKLATTCKFHNFSEVRLTMADLNNLQKRVSNLEYNLALTSLDNETLSTYQASDLRGILTDNFSSFLVSDTGDKNYNIEMDMENGLITTPEIVLTHKVTVNEGGSVNIELIEDGSYATIKQDGYKEAVSQLLATRSISVNIEDEKPAEEESEEAKEIAVVHITPSIDNTIKDEVDVQTIAGNDVFKSTRYRNFGYLGINYEMFQKMGYWYLKSYIIKNLRANKNMSESTYQGMLSYEDVGTVVKPYMNSNRIKVTGSNFEKTVSSSNRYRVCCYFNGSLIDMLDKNGNKTELAKYKGKSVVSTNSEGEFEGYIDVPDGVPCGKVQILFCSVDNTDTEGRTGNAYYTNEGKCLQGTRYVLGVKYSAKSKKSYDVIDSNGDFVARL